ncbi:MAG TPA: hypothetical protein DCW29_13360 [Janthinobacterium sp.]|nr:hypothetical protein [Janthinobacterium sp.]
MANREELGIIKGARTGDGNSQLALGKLYLYGGVSLPKSIPTALYWLQRAVQQNRAEACLLIGAHVPFELARHQALELLPSYERAFDAGIAQAGLVLAQLVLAGGAALRGKALLGLKAAARAGLPDAQWLLARHGRPAAADAAAESRPVLPDEQEQAWLTGAGGGEAVRVLLDQSWEKGEWRQFLLLALPLARALAREASGDGGGKKPAGAASRALLLSRCAQALRHCGPGYDGAEIQRFYELAAHGGDRAAQLALGLWLARMDAGGARTQVGAGTVNFKRAIRWLTQAGEQGLAEAWFALSRIYIKSEFSQRSVTQAQSYLERAADMGHGAAQFECGVHAWRTRRDGENHDVRAAYWLLKAAARGCAEAEAALLKIAPPVAAGWAGAPPWAVRKLAARLPLLAARLELAALFGLSRAEALLLDVNAADQGHCLLVDIRASYGRGKRRLVLLRTAHERRALDRIADLFEGVDCGSGGPEGNYRQRLYRLKTCLAE